MVEPVFEIAKNSLKARLKSTAMADSIEIMSEDLDKDLVHGYWMSIILISGQDLRITLKVNYQSKTVRQIMARVSEKPPEQILIHHVHDFVREFCNMTGGLIKSKLESQQVTVGMSLPLVIKGFDEIFFMLPDNKSLFEQRWGFRVPEGVLSCSALVEVINVERVGQIQPDQEDSSPADDGDVDFL